MGNVKRGEGTTSEALTAYSDVEHKEIIKKLLHTPKFLPYADVLDTQSNMINSAILYLFLSPPSKKEWGIVSDCSGRFKKTKEALLSILNQEVKL